MQAKDRLQIILITYNRAKHVENTLKQFFALNSPVKDYDFLVLDNNSTDNTEAIVKEFQVNFPNISYIKNRHNLGLSGNIAKAMCIASKDYVWIIGDDDKYDFTNWNEVEQAINNNEKIICIATYTFYNEESRKDVACQISQLTFITAGIYSTSLFDDTTVRNVIDNIYTLFPHIVPVVQFINSGGKIYITKHAISDNGMDINTTDCSYVRGNDTSQLYDRTLNMTWILGYSNVLSNLKDKSLRERALAFPVSGICGSWEFFYSYLWELKLYKRLNYFWEIYANLSDKCKIQYKKWALKMDTKLFLRNIFSVTSEGSHRVVNIYGLKMKFKKNKKRN